MTEFDRLVSAAQKAGNRQNVEYRLQPKSTDRRKREIYTHKGKSLREFFGGILETYFERFYRFFDIEDSKLYRMHKRQSGANYIKKTLDKKYHTKGFGAKVLSAHQKSIPNRNSANLPETVWESDMQHLNAIAEKLIGNEKLGQVSDVLKSDDFQRYILDELCSDAGKDAHSYQSSEQTWKAIKGQLQIDLTKLKEGGRVQDCNPMSRRLFSDLVTSSKEIEVTPESVKRLTRDHFDKTEIWKNWTKNATLKTLKSFHSPPEEAKEEDGTHGLHYIKNLVPAARDWYAHKLRSHDVGTVEKEDVDWLVNQIEHYISDDNSIDERFRDGCQIGQVELRELLKGAWQAFEQDAEHFLATKNTSRGCELTMGSELKREDILDWHDDFFRSLIDRRKAYRLRTQEGTAEAELQRNMKTFPELEEFASHKANRGRYKGLRFGATDKLGTFVKTWMDETFLSRRIDRSRDGREAHRHDYGKILSVLDDYVEFKADLDALLARYGSLPVQMDNKADAETRKRLSDATALLGIDDRKDAEELARLERKARDLEKRLPALLALSDEAKDLSDGLDSDGPPLKSQAHTLLSDSYKRIYSGIRPYLDVSQGALARLNRKRLLQLPSIQAYLNDQRGNGSLAGADDEPSGLLISAVRHELEAGKSDNGQLTAPQKQALKDWASRTAALDRYADFVNEQGARLMELESKATAKGGMKNGATKRALGGLRRELTLIERQVDALATATEELRLALGPKANLQAINDALDACDRSVKVVKWRIRSDDVELLEEEEPSEVPVQASESGSSALSKWSRFFGLAKEEMGPKPDGETFSPTFIKGPQTLPVSLVDLSRSTTTVVAIAKAIGHKDFGLYDGISRHKNPYAKRALQDENFTDTAVFFAYDATKNFPEFDEKLSKQMRENPIPDPNDIDATLAVLCEEMANARLIQKKMREDLAALKMKVNHRSGRLPGLKRPMYFPDNDKAFMPSRTERSKHYLRAIDDLNGHLATCEKVFDDRLMDFAAYLRLGHQMHHAPAESTPAESTGDARLSMQTPVLDDLEDIESLEDLLDDYMEELYGGENSGDFGNRELKQILDPLEASAQDGAAVTTKKTDGEAAQGAKEPLTK